MAKIENLWQLSLGMKAFNHKVHKGNRRVLKVQFLCDL